MNPFTNQDKNVFGLNPQLPQVIAGALFSRYSRAESSLRETYNREFSSLTAEDDADAFYDRVLIGYGDDSVAELGGAHLALEGISNVAAKAIEDSRVGLSFLEKSSRYISYDKKDSNGKYLYVTPPELIRLWGKFCGKDEPLNLDSEFEQVLDSVFETYSELLADLVPHLKSQFPKTDGIKDKAYENSIKAKALDLLRGLLPMATKTNLGIYGNGRAYEYLLTKLNASRNFETFDTAQLMLAELETLIKPFVKRVHTAKGIDHSTYLKSRFNKVSKWAKENLDPKHNYGHTLDGLEILDNFVVKLLNPENEHDCIYEIQHAILGEIGINPDDLALDVSLNPEDNGLIKSYVDERQVRQHKIGRAFEQVDLRFSVTLDIGSWRDLQRHRCLNQTVSTFKFFDSDCAHVPESLPKEMADKYRGALKKLANLYCKLIESGVTEDVAAYCVPFASFCNWQIKLTPRELIYLCELRTCKQGHANYRKIAQMLWTEFSKSYPLLSNSAVVKNFVDMNDYDLLERLDAEQKQQAKLEN